jgi:raffinose/stachyose/melibiose transport system permease protein
MKKNKTKIFPNIVMLIVMLFYLLPLWYIFNNAFKIEKFIATSPFTITLKTFTLNNIYNAFALFEYPKAFLNSSIILVLACTLLVILGSMAAYGITFVNNKLMDSVYIFFVALITVPFQITMVPLMELLKNMSLINTYLGAVFIYGGMYLPFVIFLYTGFMRTISKEMKEAAEIDGCGAFKAYLYIYMPLLKTITGIVLILRGVGIWNDLLVPLIALYSDSMYTLPLKLYTFASSLIGQWAIVFGGTFITCLPILILFLLLQKSFIKGIMAGSVKG